jgi:hypothetical protein
VRFGLSSWDHDPQWLVAAGDYDPQWQLVAAWVS